MAEQALAQRAPTVRPAQPDPAVASSPAAQAGPLQALQHAFDGSPRVAALAGTAAAMAPLRPAPAMGDMPIQRVLTQDLPAGDFFKSALTNGAHNYVTAINASIATIRTNWNSIRTRYKLLTDHGIALPHCTAYRALFTTDVSDIIDALGGAFSGTKRQKLITAYTHIRAAEGANLFTQAEAELSVYIDLDQVAMQANSANVIIDYLGARAEAGNPLFGDDFARHNARQWTFTHAAVGWTVNIITGVAAGLAHAVVDAGGHAINVTIGQHAVANAQKDIWQRHIADVIIAAWRAHQHVDASVLTAGVGAGPLTHVDAEKIASLQLIYRRIKADKEIFSANPLDGHRRLRVRQSIARFDAQVRAMNLDAPAKRTLLEAFPGLDDDANAGVGLAAVSHGVFHENQAESAARGLGNPLEDAGNIGVRVITPELIQHMIEVIPRAGDFVAMGLSGGHDTARLQAFIAAHPEYAIVRTGGRVVQVHLAGADHPLTVDTFAQYRWTGGGPAPALPAQRPPLGLVGWSVALPPKTTVDNLTLFLQEGRRTYLAWRTANAGLVGTESFGQVPGAPGHTPAAVGPALLPYGGFVRPDAVHTDNPAAAIRKLDTLFAII